MLWLVPHSFLRFRALNYELYAALGTKLGFYFPFINPSVMTLQTLPLGQAHHPYHKYFEGFTIKPENIKDFPSTYQSALSSRACQENQLSTRQPFYPDI